MPELPEVETIRLSLQKKIVGKIITHINVLEKKQFFGDYQKIIGKKIVSLERTGKVLSFKLSGGLFLNIHLKMSGQILLSVNQTPAKTTRIIIEFTDQMTLFFNDQRKFGWLKLTAQPEIPKGIDILSPAFTKQYLKKITQASKKPIKI